MDKLIENIPEILKAAAQSNLGTFALLAIALSVLAYFFFAKASIWARVGVFVLLFTGVTGFGVAMFNETPVDKLTDESVPSPVVDDTEYIVQQYTTQSEGRKSKSLTCPAGKIVVQKSAKCMNTAGNKAIKSELVSTNTWYCEWPYQAIGIGIWVEMACKTP